MNSGKTLFVCFAICTAYALADRFTVQYYTDGKCPTVDTNATTCGPKTSCAHQTTGIKDGTCKQEGCQFNITGANPYCETLKANAAKNGCQASSGLGTEKYPSRWRKVTNVDCSGASQLSLGIFAAFVVAFNLFK